MAAALTFLLYACIGAGVAHGRGVRDSGRFNVHVVERGTPFDESVVVDLVNELELIHVPAHNEVSETVFLVDFKKNVTVRKLPQLGRCYVSEIDVENLKMNPVNLKLALEDAEARPPTTAVTAVKNTWRVDEELADWEARNMLSQSALDLCDGLPMYRLRRQLSSASVGPISDSGPVHVRRKRQDVDSENSCPREHHRQRCRIRIVSCRYIYVRTCDIEYEEATINHHVKCVDNNMLHIMDRVVCCIDCCSDADKSNEQFQYCPNVTMQQIPTACSTAVRGNPLP